VFTAVVNWLMVVLQAEKWKGKVSQIPASVPSCGELVDGGVTG
jgi:hypothetical protein